jgi:hypothetical protein
MPYRESSAAMRHLMYRRAPTAVQWPSGVEASNDRRATGLRRSRKPLSVVSRIEGSNPSLRFSG